MSISSKRQDLSYLRWAFRWMWLSLEQINAYVRNEWVQWFKESLSFAHSQLGLLGLKDFCMEACGTPQPECRSDPVSLLIKLCLPVTCELEFPACKASEVNSLWPSDTIWRQRSGSTLAQVMAWCLTAPSHYLNQCWLIISEVMWHSYQGNFKSIASTIND